VFRCFRGGCSASAIAAVFAAVADILAAIADVFPTIDSVLEASPQTASRRQRPHRGGGRGDERKNGQDDPHGVFLVRGRRYSLRQ